MVGLSPSRPPKQDGPRFDSGYTALNGGRSSRTRRLAKAHTTYRRSSVGSMTVVQGPNVVFDYLAKCKDCAGMRQAGYERPGGVRGGEARETTQKRTARMGEGKKAPSPEPEHLPKQPRYLGPPVDYYLPLYRRGTLYTTHTKHTRASNARDAVLIPARPDDESRGGLTGGTARRGCSTPRSVPVLSSFWA